MQIHRMSALVMLGHLSGVGCMRLRVTEVKMKPGSLRVQRIVAVAGLMLLNWTATEASASQATTPSISGTVDEGWSLFGAWGDTTTDQWNEMRQWMSTLLDSSQALSDHMASPSLDFDMGSAANCDYPTLTSEAGEARRGLLAMGTRAIPVAINAFKGLDLAKWDGMTRAYFAHCLLAELACGHFGWEVGVESSSARNNMSVVLAWASLWQRAIKEPAIAEALMDRNDLQRLSRLLDEEANTTRSLEEQRPQFIRNEPALSPRMVARATTSVGVIAVQADDGYGRTYTWDGASRFVVMLPRHERWYGSLGIYYPGPGDHWEEHQGITRGVLSEGQQRFRSVDEAQAWLASRTYYPHVYRNDGLVVAWDKVLSRNQLNVDVWQIYIDGHKPNRLEGANDESIVVEWR